MNCDRDSAGCAEGWLRGRAWARLGMAMLAALGFSAATARAGDLTADNITAMHTAMVKRAFVVMATTNTAPATNAPASTDEQLYYSFGTNGATVADESGHGRTGTVNGATWTGNGYYGGAFTFNGSGNRITAGDILDLGGSITDLTVTAWFRTTNASGSQKWMLAKNQAAVPYTGWCVVVNGNGTVFCQAIGAYPNQVVAYGSTVVTNGQWHHVAATFHRGAGTVEASIYVDGLLEGSSAFSGTFTTNHANSQLTFGARDENGNNPFAGTIDDIRIFARPLSGEEIQAMASGWPISTNALIEASGTQIQMHGETLIRSVVKQGDIEMGVFTNR